MSEQKKQDAKHEDLDSKVLHNETNAHECGSDQEFNERIKVQIDEAMQAITERRDNLDGIMTILVDKQTPVDDGEGGEIGKSTAQFTFGGSPRAMTESALAILHEPKLRKKLLMLMLVKYPKDIMFATKILDLVNHMGEAVGKDKLMTLVKKAFDDRP